MRFGVAESAAGRGDGGRISKVRSERVRNKLHQDRDGQAAALHISCAASFVCDRSAPSVHLIHILCQAPRCIDPSPPAINTISLGLQRLALPARQHGCRGGRPAAGAPTAGW